MHIYYHHVYRLLSPTQTHYHHARTQYRHTHTFAKPHTTTTFKVNESRTYRTWVRKYIQDIFIFLQFKVWKLRSEKIISGALRIFSTHNKAYYITLHSTTQQTTILLLITPFTPPHLTLSHSTHNGPCTTAIHAFSTQELIHVHCHLNILPSHIQTGMLYTLLSLIYTIITHTHYHQV